MESKKRYFLISIISLCAVNLLAFLLFFIPNYVVDADIGYFEYIRLFINKFVEFSVPPICACLLVKLYLESGLKSALINAIFLSLPRIIYLLPYYYLYHIAYGYDSIESIALSALVCIFGAAVMWTHVTLLFLLLRAFTTRSIAKGLTAELPPHTQKNMTAEIKKGLKIQASGLIAKKVGFTTAFDLAEPITLGIFSAVFAEFLINLIREIADTANYLITFAGYYRMGEIIYIICSFVFLAAELLLVHAICYFISKRVMDEKIQRG